MTQTGDLYLGLMSGTSMDGIDAAIVRLGDRTCKFITGVCSPYPEAIRTSLLSLRSDPHHISVDTIGQLDTAIGECFANAAIQVIESSGMQAKDITAIGSHGQTIRHLPNANPAYTLQVGDPNVIASRTGIAVVADFRRADLAVGGQGAPLAPAFHQWLFGKTDRNRAVVNIGGIANLTVLPAAGSDVIGFDTGPGNTLLDGWIRRHRGCNFDDDGQWAAGGSVCESLLDTLLHDPYFAEAAPKSTGFEYFNLDWLDQHLEHQQRQPSAQDVQTTLAELSARTISDAVLQHAPDIAELFICGGGYRNSNLVDRLKAHLPTTDIQSTSASGIDADWIEAAAFAWLARCRLDGMPGNLPSVTGARKRALLGGIFLPPR